MTEPVLKVENLKKHYGEFCLTIPFFELDGSMIQGIIGPNGSGKTTLFKCILGLVTPDSGTIDLFGRPVDRDDPDLRLLKERIGTVFDVVSFPQGVCIKDLTLLGSAYSQWDSPYFLELLKQLDVDPRKTVKDLSRGMGMKLSLAFALAHDPQLLLLDEATAGLDPLARDEIYEHLRDFVAQPTKDGRDRSIILATHITEDLAAIADSILCLDEGQIVFDVAKDDIVNYAGIARCRSVDLEVIRTSKHVLRPLRVLERQRECDILVPNRFEFSEQFPHIVCEPITIDEYMKFYLKGASL